MKRWGVVLVTVIVFVGLLWWLVAQKVRQDRLDRGLIEAILSNNTAKGLACLKQGADPNARMSSVADSVSLWENLQYLLYWRKLPDRGDTALLLSLNNSDENGNSVENAVLVQALLDKGARVDVRDMAGRTPMMLAINWKYDKVPMKLLLQHGANPNVWIYGGVPTLIEFASTGNVEEMKMLLASGADPNARGANGDTALMWAAYESQEESVNLLMQYNARFSLVDKRGKTALDLAKSRKQPRIIRMLEEAGARH